MINENKSARANTTSLDASVRHTNMKRAIKKRICMRLVSILTLISTLLNSFVWYGLPAFSVTDDNVSATDVSPAAYITRDGNKITQLTISDDEKVTLSAVCETDEKLSYKWQILDAYTTDRWIDISGAFMSEIAVSYSLVGSMTNGKGEAYIRCYMLGSDEYITDALQVRISYGVEETDDNSSRPMTMTGSASVSRMLNSSARADETEHTTHSIVINYLFDNNAIAFEPYGATVAHGSDFRETVTSPTVVGYAPFRRVGEDYIDASVVELNYENIQSDITINIIYEPALVEFSVHHHLQNLFDDDYSLTYDYITTSYALTGSLVPEGLAFTEAQLPGFKALSYERLTVAADGSTVIEIRYDRNYYLVDFDMNGGYGTDPVYTRFGSTVGANTPVRHGYVFNGWELVLYGGNAATSEQQSKYALTQGSTIILPDANLRYRARWITTKTTYTMVFWQENANDNGYTYWGYLDGLGAMSGSFVDGQDLISQVDGIDDEQYFTFNSEKTDKGVLVEGDGSTVVNVYYTRNYYKLTIKSTGACTIPTGHTHTDGCYDHICIEGHTHTQECLPSLKCLTPEHTEHTDACIACGKTEHIHGSSDCDCNISEHTHTQKCWSTVIGNAQNKPSGAPSSPSDGQVYRRNNSNKYIYIKGTWYTYTGKASNGNIVDPTCGYSAEHVHGTNCACNEQAHVHSDTCWGDLLHTHTEYCYSYSCGQTAHTHSNSCLRLKCGITENHTHNTTCKSSSSTNVVKIIYRKYGQSIEDIWPIVDDNGVSYNSGERWSPSDSSYYSQVLVYLSKMPPDDFTLTLNRANYSTYTMKYYLQVLPGTDLSGIETTTYNGITYALFDTIKANYNYVTKAEDFFDIKGFYQYASSPSFSNNQISISGSDKTVKFYYNRITDHYLEFNNNGIILDDKQKYGIMYGAPLAEYNFTPDYPSNLEPNAYEFAGWYVSPGCFDGTEVDWATLTMTEGDLLLYAKWAPVKHSVKVYLDSSLSVQIGEEQFVDHNAFATAPLGNIENGNYIFQGWFYKDVVNGEIIERAFVFSGIPVTDDMKIYAKWSSHVSVDYKINYVLLMTKEPIADPTIGSAIAGNNKTFDAKAGDQLYSGFQTGFYPLTNSHTITMSVDGTHEFTFYYVYVESMPYVVRYVNAATGEQLLPDKVIRDNTYSVVTETFVRIDGMMPDAYQKRLVLSASETDMDGDGIFDENVITFYYNSDEEHAYYKVVHYIQNIGGDTYREYRSVETVGIIGNVYTIDALTLTGFDFIGSLTTVNGVNMSVTGEQISCKLGAEGMLIELYYNRAEYSYTVRYTDGDTGLPIRPDKHSTAPFGSQVLEYALDLSAYGYSLSSENLKMLNISVNVESNVIEFIYLESIVSVKYQIMGLPGSGSLSRNSENVKAITGNLSGSVPTASKGYLFVGWFMDADCTISVDPSFVDPTTMRLTPKKGDGEIWKENVIYYAKFIPKETKLTVINSGWNVTDTDQAFLYRIVGVEGTETEEIDLIFSIKGNGSTTIAGLPVGDYTVTLISDWSWRYECYELQKSITLSVDQSQNVLEFSSTRSEDKWLDGNASSDNLYS